MPIELVGYLAAIVMGLVLGILGGGGSILTVPILVYLFHLSATTASGYSLFIVGLTAAFGAVLYARRGEIDAKTGLIFALPSLVGTFAARRWLVPALPVNITHIGGLLLTRDLLILLVFASIMVLAAFSMIRPQRVRAHRPDLAQHQRWLMTGAEGFGVGIITGFVGAGGGFLVIPALVLLAGLPMKVAVGTSLMVIAIKSLVGFAGDLSLSTNMQWSLLMSLTALALVGNILGSSLSRRVPAYVLKPAFGWFVLAMGVWIISRELHLM